MIELHAVSKVYPTPTGPLTAVDDVTLKVARGDIFGIAGFSGAGKSTLVRLMNLLERPTQGQVWVDEVDLLSLTPAKLRQARRSIAMIFQSFNLIRNKTVAHNVAFPLEIAGIASRTRDERVRECLDIVGLTDKATMFPAMLSGGQCQRVAIARAIANQPSVLLCDEPTSSLDPRTAGEVLTFLRKVNRQLGVTIVLVTHQMSSINAICNKVAVMEAGRLVECYGLEDVDYRPVSEIGRHLSRDRQIARRDAWTPEFADAA